MAIKPRVFLSNCGIIVMLYTTSKNMEYLQTTIERLVLNILICWKWFGTIHKQVLLLLCNSHVQECAIFQ